MYRKSVYVGQILFIMMLILYGCASVKPELESGEESKFDPILPMCQVLDPDIADTYEGDCRDGLADGFGKASGKDSYEGEFKAGWQHGQGIYHWENGDWYEGEWIDGKENGDGIIEWASGSHYEGEFSDGMMNGKGIFTSENGDVYEGTFVNNKKEGKGTMRYADGSVKEGIWEAGKLKEDDI